MRSAAISRETANWILSDNIVRQKMQKLFSGKMRIAQESLDLSTLKAIDMASTAAYLSDKIG
jgi:hypothetical protein